MIVLWACYQYCLQEGACEKSTYNRVSFLWWGEFSVPSNNNNIPIRNSSTTCFATCDRCCKPVRNHVLSQAITNHEAIWACANMDNSAHHNLLLLLYWFWFPSHVRCSLFARSILCQTCHTSLKYASRPHSGYHEHIKLVNPGEIFGAVHPHGIKSAIFYLMNGLVHILQCCFSEQQTDVPHDYWCVRSLVFTSGFPQEFTIVGHSW